MPSIINHRNRDNKFENHRDPLILIQGSSIKTNNKKEKTKIKTKEIKEFNKNTIKTLSTYKNQNPEK